MSDYTLTTEEVRGLWVVTMFKRNASDTHRNLTIYRDEFDRWLEQVKQEARAEARDEAVSIAEQTAAATLSLDATLAALRTGKKEQDR